MGSIVLFSGLTLVSYILIVLNIPYLFIPILLVLIFKYYKYVWNLIKTIKISLNKQVLVVLFVFTLGIIGQLAIIAPSGTYQNGDLVFWSAHGHDGMWHLALMDEMKSGYPFDMPVFAGEKLTNYHFFSDILPTMVSKYFKVSDLDLYFRIFPLYYSVALGASVFFLTKKLTKSLPAQAGFNASIWATIFTYFAGSFGYLIGKGESVFWATQIQSSSGNPPQIISNFLFLAAIYYVLTYLDQTQKRLKLKYFLISFIILGTISAFKIYAGVILLGTLSIIGTWNLIFKKDFRLFFLSLLSGIISLILYLPNSSGSSSFLIFEPWWYIRTMIVEPSRLNLLDWELRRQTYIYEHNWKRVICLEGMGFLIFFFGNLGMRFLGLWEFIKSNAIFKISIVLSLVLPLLFLQKGVASNTAQFLQYFILLFGILAGIATAKLLAKIRNPIYYIPYTIFLLLLMIPTQFTLLKDFYIADDAYGNPKNPRPAFTKVSAKELEALKFIKDNTDKTSVILTPPYNQYYAGKESIPHIWDWFDTSYVSALTSRRTYFDDYEQVDIMGYDYKPRLKIKEVVFNSEKIDEVKTTLKSTNANILYYPKAITPKVDINSLGFTKIFGNNEVLVWKLP